MFIWFAAWTPYATVAMTGAFGNKDLVRTVQILILIQDLTTYPLLLQITPLVAQIPAFGSKMASCFNPIVFAFHHPKYRQALTTSFPCLGITEEPEIDTKTVKTEAAE